MKKSKSRASERGWQGRRGSGVGAGHGGSTAWPQLPRGRSGTIPYPWQQGWGQGRSPMGAPSGWGVTPQLATARVAKLGAHPGAQHPPGSRKTPSDRELLFPSRQPSRREAILSRRRRDERVTAPTPPSPARQAGLSGINKSKARGIRDGIGEETRQPGRRKQDNTAGPGGGGGSGGASADLHAHPTSGRG